MCTVLSHWENGTAEVRWLLSLLSSEWSICIGSLLGTQRWPKWCFFCSSVAAQETTMKLCGLTHHFICQWRHELAIAAGLSRQFFCWLYGCPHGCSHLVARLWLAGWCKMASLLFLSVLAVTGPCSSSRLAQASTHGSWVPNQQKKSKTLANIF